MKIRTLTMLVVLVLILGVVPANAFEANVSYEINVRYYHLLRYQDLQDNGWLRSKTSGFRFYEFGIMADAQVTDWCDGYAEFNFNHGKNPAEAEEVWIDIHLPEERPAWDRGTGLRVGILKPPFGFGNDDCEGWLYEGRTGINVPLLKGTRFDGQKIRTRMLGMQANYNLELEGFGEIVPTVCVFNGPYYYKSNGAGGTDNDIRKDALGRLEVTIDPIYVTFGGSYWYLPKNAIDTVNINDVSHVRDIQRIGAHFRFPTDASFPGGDVTLGGRRFHIWGEYAMGKHKANTAVAGYGSDLEWFSFWGELDVNLVTDLLTSYVRFDYMEPNKAVDEDEYQNVTGGLLIAIRGPGPDNITLEYTHYLGGDNVSDKTLWGNYVAAEMQIYF